jgi:hypothetical protein
MKLAILVVTVILLQGCSSIQDSVRDLFLPIGDDNDCSLNSNPICIPIGGQKVKMEGDNYKMAEFKVGKYFKMSDFKCKCGCGEINYTPRLVKVLDDLTERFQRDVIVTSGYRCDARNKEVGGVDGSLHTEGRAIDFVVRGVSPAKVVQYLSEFDGGLGLYERHVHIDTGIKKRWTGNYDKLDQSRS